MLFHAIMALQSLVESTFTAGKKSTFYLVLITLGSWIYILQIMYTVHSV